MIITVGTQWLHTNFNAKLNGSRVESLMNIQYNIKYISPECLNKTSVIQRRLTYIRLDCRLVSSVEGNRIKKIHIIYESIGLQLFILWYFSCEISHVTSHMWNMTCETPHVKFYMWKVTCDMGNMWYVFHMQNFTCGISHATFRMQFSTWDIAFEISWVQSDMYNCTEEKSYEEFQIK